MTDTKKKIRKRMQKLKMLMLTEPASPVEKAEAYSVWMAWIEGLYIAKVINNDEYCGLYAEVASFRRGMDFLVEESEI